MDERTEIATLYQKGEAMMGGPEPWRNEADLLVPIQTYLLDRFSARLEPASGSFDKHAEIVAWRGGRAPLGSWSRPDLALVTVWRPEFAAATQLRLYTFEVKTANGASVEAVYEALAHSRFGHGTFVVWHAPDEVSQNESAIHIRKACERHGVGLILMTEPTDSRSYRIEVASAKQNPELEVVDEFIDSRFSEPGREVIRRMLRVSS